MGQVLTAKRVDPDADVSALERKIDEQVYQLYGLTAKEVAIVEEVTSQANRPRRSTGKGEG